MLIVLALVFLPFVNMPATIAIDFLHTSSEEPVRPVAVADRYQVLHEGVLDIRMPGVLENDLRAESAMLTEAPRHGTLVLRADGSFHYEHDGSEAISDSFTYQAENASGVSESVTVELQIDVVSFGFSELMGHLVSQPTSLQFGPDDRLYALRKKGMFNVIELTRNGPNDYGIVNEEVVTLARFIPNHDDDGEPNEDEKVRQATGLYVTGTASNPVVYINTSDPRVGGHANEPDTHLDTNSGVLSRVSWNGTSRDDPSGFWEKIDLVRGLPRSEENHAPNGIQLSVTGDTLFMATGSGFFIFQVISNK